MRVVIFGGANGYSSGVVKSVASRSVRPVRRSKGMGRSCPVHMKIENGENVRPQLPCFRQGWAGILIFETGDRHFTLPRESE